MTEQELIDLAKEQVRQLSNIMRLQNWDFTVTVVSALDFIDTHSGSWAELWSNAEDYTAIVKLSQARWLYKVEWDDEEIRKLRQTLAHELAYLYFHISRTFADEKYREEWMCEMIADVVTRAGEGKYEEQIQS